MEEFQFIERDSHNISIITSAAIISSSKPTYAAVLAKALTLPATVAQRSSATPPSSSLPVNHSKSEPMAEGFKLMTSESSKGFIDGSSLKGTQSLPSPSEKQVNSDETMVPTSCRPELISENHSDPPSPRLSYNISITTLPSNDISPPKFDSSVVIDSSSKPTYAAVDAKSLPLPATMLECTSATSPSSLWGNDSEHMSEGLKLMTSESSKDLAGEPFSLQSQVPQSPLSQCEKQLTSDEILMSPSQQEPTSQNGASLNGSHGQPQSAVHGATSATGSHNSSLSHYRPRSTRITGYGSMIHNVNVVPQHHGMNQNCNTHRSFHGRNMHIPRRGHAMFARPPPPPPLPLPPPASYSYPCYFPQPPVMPPVPPYGVSYGFPADLGYHMSYHATPVPSPFIGASYVPSIRHYPIKAPEDRGLHARIVKQIHYYFSFDNLVKDIYLRKQMDHDGWIPIRIIAGFPKIKKLTSNIQIITDALQTSSLIEISDNKIRRRVDWKRWILHDSFQLP